MALADPSKPGQIDRLFKRLFDGPTRFALRLTAGVPEDERILVQPLDAELLRTPRCLDRAFLIEENGRRHVRHVEAQAHWRGDEPERLAWYATDLFREYRVPVRSTLVLLFEDRCPATIPRAWRVKGGDIRLATRFDVKRLWESDARELLGREESEPLEWTPVLHHDDAACLEAYRRLDAKGNRDGLLNFMLLGGFRYGIDRWREVMSGYGESVMYDNVIDMLEGDEFGRQVIAGLERRGWERGLESGMQTGLEKGMQTGIEKGRAEGREELRTLIRSWLQDHYPALDAAAVGSVNELSRLRAIAGSLLRARTEDEARRALAG